jgi:hypothetical protein
VRHYGRPTLLSLERLWTRLAEETAATGGVIEPEGLEVLAWDPYRRRARFMPVMAATRRQFDGELVELRTKMGRRVRCTPDHPWVVADGRLGDVHVRRADELSEEHWLPLAQGVDSSSDAAALVSLAGAVETSGASPERIAVRPPRRVVAELVGRPVQVRRSILSGPQGVSQRTFDVKRTGALSLAELRRAELPLEGSRFSTVRNGQYVRTELELDSAFWRVVGLYLAEGHTSVEPTGGGVRHRISWSFHPTEEEHLVDEVVAFWLRHGVEARVRSAPTTRHVSVSSRLLGSWWLQTLGMGRTS